MSSILEFSYEKMSVEDFSKFLISDELFKKEWIFICDTILEKK